MPTACVNPPSLSPRVQSVDEMTGTWWVAQTRPQYEKKLARELQARGVDYFLPLVSYRKVLAGKRRVIVSPWFPSYVFVNGDADARYAAASSACTAIVRNVVNQEQLARDLVRVEAWLPKELVSFESESLKPGIRCRVKAGHSMEGMEGWIDELTGKGRVVVSITILGTSRPVDIDPEFLEPV